MSLISAPIMPYTCFIIGFALLHEILRVCIHWDLHEGREHVVCPAALCGREPGTQWGSLIPCRNECMTELKQRAQGIPQAGESKTDGGQSNYKGNNTASDVLPPSSQRAG